MNNKSLPRSNHSPSACSPTSGDRIGGIPDMVQRPARKGYDCEDIGPGMKCSDKGYKIVDVKAGGDTAVLKNGKGRKMKVEVEYEGEDES